MNLILQQNAWKEVRPSLRLFLLWVYLGSFWIAANGDSLSPWQDGALAVAESTRHAYGLRDDTGRTMDALQVVEHPHQGYLGVYHTLEDGVFRANLARSSDLMLWQFVRGIGGLRTAMPSIYGTSNLGFLVVFEASDAAGEIHLHFDAYANLADLEGGRPLRSFDAPILLSSTSVKAEGTPCIESVFLDPDWDHSLVELSFHYFDERRPAVDRQARGWLRNFSHWTAKPEASLDEAMEQLGIQGNLGDRDVAASPKGLWRVIEGHRGSVGSPSMGNLAPLSIGWKSCLPAVGGHDAGRKSSLWKSKRRMVFVAKQRTGPWFWELSFWGRSQPQRTRTAFLLLGYGAAQSGFEVP